MIAALVDTEALLKVVAGALGAGLTVAVAYALVIVGAARSSEHRAAGRGAAAAAYAALGVIGLVAYVSAIAVALVIIASK